MAGHGVTAAMPTQRAATYILALLVGIAAALAVLPADTILGAGPGWEAPFRDQAQSLAGHLAFQADAWRWPLLRTETLFWTHGVSIALTDSNPLASLVAKLWVTLSGRAPVNLLGAWLAACLVLQPVAAAYAARGLRLGLAPCAAAGALAACWPALLFRMGHVNLCGHFLLLLALGLVLRRPHGGRWGAPAALLLAAVLVHPYLFQLVVLMLAAIPLQAVLDRRAGWRRDVAGLLVSGVLAVAVLRLLSGPLGGGDKGFVTYSMNLLSPVWPQVSGVFGAGLPVLDATGGQYEGFNYLGAGVLLLGAVALAGLVWRPAPWRQWRGLLMMLGGLALLSLSSRVYAGPVRLIDLGAKPWEDLFGTFRAPGRAFWPVGYALMLGAVAGAARLPARSAAAVLAVAAVLQVVDAGPLRAGARSGWERGAGIPVTAVPASATLFGIAPHPGCTTDAAAQAEGPLMLLQAVRHGIPVWDVGVGRPPPWFNCEALLSDRLEAPLAVGEARGYFGTAAAALRPAWLGAGVVCQAGLRATLCGRGLPGFVGVEAVPPAPVDLPLRLEGAAVASLLGSGWRVVDGTVWSEGPRATLLLAVPPGVALTLTIQAEGIATRPGTMRAVQAHVGDQASAFDLPDGQAGTMELHIPAGAVADGLLRVVLDVNKPVDPMIRGISAPVRRAAMRLLSVGLRAAGS